MTSNSVFFAYLLFCPINIFAGAILVNLGSATPFAVLAGSTVTNTGSSIIDGDLGLSPGTSITGFPPGTVDGTVDAGNSAAALAQGDLTTAYNFAASEPCGTSLTGQDLAGLTLTPGVYCFSSSAQLSGTLTLNALGDPNAVFVFEIGSALTTGANSSVVFINGDQGGNVFWQVGGSTTLGADTAFQGSILALTSVTLDSGASIGCGRALASNGAVTLDSNNISIDSLGCDAAESGTVPEPGTASLLGMSLLAGSAHLIARRSRRDGRVALNVEQHP
jgi:hypothetical protein